MNQTIKEVEIDDIQPRDFKNVLLVRPGEPEFGIEVFHVRILGAFQSGDVPAPVLTQRQLLIEVEDPDSAETQNRIRVKLMERAKVR